MGTFTYLGFTTAGLALNAGGSGISWVISPRGIAVGLGGAVYFVDSTNNNVVYEGARTEGSANGQFIMPTGLMTDVLNNVFVTDTGNHRIQVFSPDPASSSSSHGVVVSGGGGGGSGCVIAAVTYRSYLDAHIATLRRFRDRLLLTNRLGKVLVALYYRQSPTAANFIRGHEHLKAVTRWVLTPFVYAVEYPEALLLALVLGIAIAADRRRLCVRCNARPGAL